MGERKDWRLIFPGHDRIIFCGRQQVDILEARDLQRSFYEAGLQAPPAQGRDIVIAQRLF